MDIYREEILENYRSPSNWGLKEGGLIGHEINQICGDEFTVQIFVKDNLLEEMRFEGEGCAISKAANSFLSEYVKGKSIEDVKSLSVGDVQELLGIELPPRRIQCAMLGLGAVKKVLSSGKGKSYEDS